MAYATYFPTLGVCFLRKKTFYFVTTIQLSSGDFSKEELFPSLPNPLHFQIITLNSWILFIQCIPFDAQSVSKFTTGWLLYPVDMSLSVFKDLLILERHKNMSQAHFVLFLPQTWNQLFFLRSLSSFEWGMVFGNQDLSTRYAHL